MKRIMIKTVALVAVLAGTWGCGNDFLNTDYYGGIDVDTGMNNVINIETALNGTYYRLIESQFGGRNAVVFGDVPTDISYRNGSTAHWDAIYQYTYVSSDGYLDDIWEYGYKIIDNSARVIQAANAIYADSSEEDQVRLDIAAAEAYALRGYARLILVNVYAHQIKVAGTDFSSQPGIVISEEPIPAFTEVTRATVGESYAAIVSDFTNALDHFAAAGEDRASEQVYFNAAAVNGLLARTYLYMENWSAAATSAQAALTASGISTLAYTAEAYKALYYNELSNTESMFLLAITTENSWGGNSAGTLWESYGMNPSEKLKKMYAEGDCRLSVFTYNAESTAAMPVFGGGKFAHFQSGDPSRGTSGIVNAPEMFLIIAEANLKGATPNTTAAAEALLTVAKRNPAIKTVADLPSDAAGMISFLKDERARELFQEGLRLWDLRRWDERTEVYAYGSPEQKFTYTGYQISNLVYPIPEAEINSGWGVSQNEGYDATRPR